MRIYKRGRVYWVAYYSARTKRTERTSTKCTDREAARRAGERIERDAADPGRAEAETATLAGALDAVIAEYEHRVGEGKAAADTLSFYRKRASQVVRMIDEGHLPRLLADLRAKHVDKMIDQRRAEGSKRNTISKDLIVLRLALKLAKRREQWFGAVDEVLPHRFSSEYEPRRRWLPPAELEALCSHLPAARARWVRFAVATGANFSEAQKARREDITERDGKPEKVHLRGTKRELRDRDVPIIRPWQLSLLTEALRGSPAGALFAPWANANRDLKEAAKAAGIAPLSTNDLRRTFGTWLRADGVEISTIAAAMGHTDSRMAEQVYAKLNAEQLAALMGGPSPVPAGGTVSNLYEDACHQSESLDLSHSKTCSIPAESGSSCWTRTSDPVINSPRVIGGSADVCACSGARCPMVYGDELAGLARAASSLEADWDLLELAAGGG